MIGTLGMPSRVKADTKLDLLVSIAEHSAGDLILQEIATGIAKAESGFNPSAKNPASTATGIFQFLIGTWKHYDCEGTRWDYEDNISCALRVMKEVGFSDWEASQWGKFGWYKQLSPEARLRVSEGLQGIVERNTAIVAFAGGKVKINNKGAILKKDGSLFKGGDIPFVE